MSLMPQHDVEQLISMFVASSQATAKASLNKAHKQAEKLVQEQKIGLNDLRDHH